MQLPISEISNVKHDYIEVQSMIGAEKEENEKEEEQLPILQSSAGYRCVKIGFSMLNIDGRHV